MIIQWLIRLHKALLYLYPRSFRVEFAEEMQEVFSQAIRAASLRSFFSLAYLCLNELLSLPRSLVLVRRSGHRQQGTLSALPLPAENSRDQSWQELLLVLAVFLLPAGVILLNQSPQTPAPSALLGAFLFLGVMLFIGWLGGFPLWSLPYVGFVIVIAGYLVLFQWVIGMISPALISNFSPGLMVGFYQTDQNAYLLLKAASTGMLWLMLFCLTLLVIALLVVFNRLQPLLGRVRHDWTLLSYILYGESIFALLLLFQSQRFELSYVIAGMLCLLAGVWFYLRSLMHKQRLLALLGCLTLAMAIAALNKWPFVATLPGFSGNDFRPADLGRLLFAWAWMAFGLLLPGLLAHLPPRFRTQG